MNRNLLQFAGKILAVTSTALLCGPGINAGNGCKLTVSVVDGFGTPLPQDRVAITVIDSSGSAVSYQDHLLPYGRYEVKASCPMFNLFQRSIDLKESSALVVAGLLMIDAGNLSGDSVEGGYSITGKLLGVGSSDRPIVRLLASYGDLVLDRRPAASGDFAFRDLPGGRYIVAGLSTRHRVVTNEVRVGDQYGDASVVLRLR